MPNLSESQQDLGLLTYEMSWLNSVVVINQLEPPVCCDFVKSHHPYGALNTLSKHPDAKQMSKWPHHISCFCPLYQRLITQCLLMLVGRLVSVYTYLPLMLTSSSRPGTATETTFPHLLNYLMKTRKIISQGPAKECQHTSCSYKQAS